jgi:hypothetical protein
MAGKSSRIGSGRARSKRVHLCRPLVEAVARETFACGVSSRRGLGVDAAHRSQVTCPKCAASVHLPRYACDDCGARAVVKVREGLWECGLCQTRSTEEPRDARPKPRELSAADPSPDGATCGYFPALAPSRAPLTLAGTEVIPVGPPHYDDEPAGWVAHARLSDGTLSWPAGAPVRPTREAAERDARWVVMATTGPVAHRAQLEARVGRTWDTDELRDEFEVRGFGGGLCVVARKSDGKVGSLMFEHSPRLYHSWQED